jgi:hypothetical protein
VIVAAQTCPAVTSWGMQNDIDTVIRSAFAEPISHALTPLNRD